MRVLALLNSARMLAQRIQRVAMPELCHDHFLAQEWAQQVTRAWLLKDAKTLHTKLHAAERMNVDASILSASGAGFILNADRVWGLLPNEWQRRRQALLLSWKAQAKKRGAGQDKALQPFAGLRADAFEAAVMKMAEFLQGVEESALVSAWQLDAAVLLVRPVAFKTPLIW